MLLRSENTCQAHFLHYSKRESHSRSHCATRAPPLADKWGGEEKVLKKGKVRKLENGDENVKVRKRGMRM